MRTRASRMIRFVPPVVMLLLVAGVWVRSLYYFDEVWTPVGSGFDDPEGSAIACANGWLAVVFIVGSDFDSFPILSTEEITPDREFNWRRGIHLLPGRFEAILPLWYLTLPPLLWILYLLKPWRWRKKQRAAEG